MSKPIKGMVRSSSGPHKSAGRWQVIIYTWDGGKHSRTFGIKANATKFLKAHPPEGAEPEQELDKPRKRTNIPRGPAGWTKLLGRLAAELLNEDHPARKKEIRLDLAALANAGKTVKGLHDQGALEKRVEAMEKRQVQIRIKRKHGTGTRGETRSPGG